MFRLQMNSEYKIQCSLCFKLFSSAEELKVHYKTTHEVNELKPV